MANQGFSQRFIDGSLYVSAVTSEVQIQVKQVSDWKGVLPQILTYSAFFPEHTKRIHLFGDCTSEKKLVISSTLLGFDVIGTFEEVENGH